jgi:hypothetical protein
MEVWGSGSFRVTITAVCAVLWIQWTSPTWQWYSRRFDTQSDGASLLGTSNDFLAIREVHLNTKHVANVHYTSLQLLFWLWAGWPRGQSSSPGRVKNFLYSTASRPALGSTQPPIQWVLGVLSQGIKRPGREADHSPPASAEAKKMWIYTSTPHTPSWRSA